ncbi:leucine-rich repeat flightless-interacting protein 1 isoform X1 [Myripristis murdjan]|uniref:leucine-rich repeat flightless-interacting protein 1 isoform X1 n=1 Tax=Myripristis murdjan TaxID=586833 RepID=UPI001175E6D5|nr:leucine-rich repeat flightless-interacting protein 1-like isoform X1 [Myripristis murdjan]
MGTQGTGRKRNPNKERSTAEDDALNLIAREAEARLAAKRAARAEAREIRMKELERQQKELSDDDERMSVGSRGSVRVEDRDYLEKGSRAASALTAATLTSLGGTSSRRGSGETAITLDTEASIREIKEIHELKDQIQDVESKYTQNLKEIKDALVEVEEKYRKAMVSNAQLDNEKNNLMYQVDTLKDSLMELEELLSESRREYEEKVKEYEREKHAHSVLQFQFNEMKETLKQSEELLNKHGIVLGPDLNINGEVIEGETEGSSSGDPASRLAQDSQTSPMEGNSMLGSTQEIQLRSSGEEEVAPDQHQEILKEAKEIHSSSETPCNLTCVSTSREEQEACLQAVEDGVRENAVSNDSDVEINDSKITDEKNTVMYNSQFEGIATSPEEKLTGTEMVEVGDIEEASKGEIGAEKISTVDSENIVIECSDDMRETCNSVSEEQVNRPEDAEGSKSAMSCTDLCPDQEATEDNMKVCSPDDSTSAVSNIELQHEAVNAEEAENEELEEISNKSQTRDATGKKKKKKRRGKKKKGGAHEDEKQKSDAKEKSVLMEKENSKTEKDLDLPPSNNEPTAEPEVDNSSIKALQESRVNTSQDEQDKAHVVETDGVEAVESVMSINTQSNVSAVNLTDNSETTQGTEEHDGECTANIDNSKYETEVSTKTGVVQIESEIADIAENETWSINEVKLESTTDSPEDTVETTDCKENLEVDSPEPTNADAPTDQSESTNNSEIEDNKSVVPLNDDGFTDCLESSSFSEGPSTMISAGNDAAIVVSIGDPVEVTETVKDEEEPGVKMEQKSFSCSATAADHDEGYAEIKLDRTGEEELNGGLSGPEESPQLDSTSVPFPTDTETSDSTDSASSSIKHNAFVPENSISETDIQAEHFDDVSSFPVESQDLNTAHRVDQNDESKSEFTLETEESDIRILQTADSDEVADIDSPNKQDDSDGGSAIAQDHEHQNSQYDQGSEKSPCPEERQQDDSNDDKPDDSTAPQPAQQDSNEEDDEDEEGQSFDFDDMDMEEAIAANDSLTATQEDDESGVEVTSDEDNNDDSVASHCDSASNEVTEPQLQTEEEPAESNEKKCTTAEDSKADIPDELDTVSEADPNSVDNKEAPSEKGEDEQQNTVEKESGVADESRDILEEGEAGIVGELGIVASNLVEEVNQELCSPVGQGEDAIKHELQSEGKESSDIEPPLSRKDSKKNSKKGKTKGKEECKMS